jgi:hypothetical protein
VSGLQTAGTNAQWYDQPTGGLVLASGVALYNGKHYYASQNINDCESTQRLDVTVAIKTPATPDGEPKQKFCEGSTVDDLAATAVGLIWYENESGGTVVEKSATLENDHTYFATQTIEGCESTTRLSVTADVVPIPDAPTGLSPQQFEPGINLSEIVVTGTEIMWYASADDAELHINSLAAATPLTAGASYYATQSTSGCESVEWLTVTMASVTSVNVERVALEYYPNPIVDGMIILADHMIKRIDVVNSVGITLVSKSVDDTSTVIDLKGYQSGSYLLRVYYVDHTTALKIVKK